MAAKRKRHGSRNPRSEAIAIQKLLLKDIEDKATTPTARAQLARAWEVLEERLRILNGKALPGQLRPDIKPKEKRSRKPDVLPLPVVESPAVGQ